MPFPLIPVLAATAAGAGIFFGYEKFAKPKLAALPPPEGPLPGTVSELKQGQDYAVQAALSGSQPGGGTQKFTSVDQAAQFLKNFFQSVGFDLGASIPTLRDKDNSDKFQAGLTSAWIFTARWTRPEKFVGGEGSPMIGMALFTPLPAK